MVATDGYVFEEPSFSFQFMRAMGCAVYGGADIVECVHTAQGIKEGDFESWCREWTYTAERVKRMGDAALAEGHLASAAESYLRAGTYFRTAEFYLHGNPRDPRILHLWGESRDLFVRSLQLSGANFERVGIAYEGTTLPGYFYKVDDIGRPRATIVVQTGYDGTQEELYPYALAALKRGYNVLTFEGPG